MILHHLRLRGLSTAFRDEVAVDFDALPPGLIALVGENGAGKSTLLSASGPAVLYREFADYEESFADHIAPGIRNAFAELVFSLGARRYRARVQADPQFNAGRGKQEAYLFACDPGGDRPLAGPLVREFDQTIATILPPRELFLASVFACQGGLGSFFGLAKGARKDLFVAMLGLSHLQALSEQARARAQAVLVELGAVREEQLRLDGQRARAAELDATTRTRRTLLEPARAGLAIADRAADETRRRLAAAQERLTRLEAEAARVAGERQRLERSAVAIAAERAELETRRAGLTSTVAERATVAAALGELVDVDAALVEAQAAAQGALAAQSPLEAEIAAADAERTALLRDHERLTTDLAVITAAVERLRQAPGVDIERAERAAADAEAARGQALKAIPALEVAAAEEQHAATEKTRLAAKRSVLTGRAALLAEIPGVPACATCPLTADARQADHVVTELDTTLARLLATEGLPAAAALTAGRDRLAELERAARRTAVALSQARQAATRQEADQALAAREPEAQTARAEVLRQGTALRDRLVAAREQAERLRAASTAAGTHRDALATRRRTVAALADRHAAIEAAAAQLGEVESALARVAREALDVETALAALASVEESALHFARSAVHTGRGEVEEAATLLTERRREVATLETELARAEGERSALGDVDGRTTELTARATTLATTAADWALLEKGLGKDGVQALEVDAAGPAVTAIANELLLACYGPRFTLALETTARKKDGGQKEVFDVRILDAEAGREARRGSGGEMVILDEALRLALAIGNARQSAVELRTLWRDETAGALSPQNADRYVAMLRRAQAIGNFQRVLFVSHQPAVWEQSDAQLFVGGGQVRTEREAVAA